MIRLPLLQMEKVGLIWVIFKDLKDYLDLRAHQALQGGRRGRPDRSLTGGTHDRRGHSTLRLRRSPPPVAGRYRHRQSAR